MLTTLPKPSRTSSRAHSRILVLTAFLCLAVLAMLSVAQVTHTHAVSRDADHCAICVVLHSAIPVAAAATLVVLVHCVAVVPIFAAPPVSRIWHVQLFNRPPPASCPASFRFF